MLKNKATKIVVSLAGLLCMGSLFCGCGNTIEMATISIKKPFAKYEVNPPL